VLTEARGGAVERRIPAGDRHLEGVADLSTIHRESLGLEVPAERTGPNEVPAPRVVVGDVDGVVQPVLDELDPRMRQRVFTDDRAHGLPESRVIRTTQTRLRSWRSPPRSPSGDASRRAVAGSVGCRSRHGGDHHFTWTPPCIARDAPAPPGRLICSRPGEPPTAEIASFDLHTVRPQPVARWRRSAPYPILRHRG
jgi:hypothetical protein